MPTFDFQCSKCEHEWEQYVLRATKDWEKDVRCTACGCAEWQRLVNSFANYTIKGNNSASVTPKNKSKI